MTEEINYSSFSLEELDQLLKNMQKKSSDYYNEEQAVKLTLNSIYGALGNQYFALFNTDVAESVTLQGQDIWKFAEKIVNRYFNDMWHIDTELHEKMGVSNVRKLSRDFVLYGDTDSSIGDTTVIIEYNNLIERIKFKDLFKIFSKTHEIFLDHKNNEIIEPRNLQTLNYKDDVLFSKVKKIIRHKVRKAKWKIITSSGKEIIVTNDHSITIFRDGKKIHIKPSEINMLTDEILSIDIDI